MRGALSYRRRHLRAFAAGLAVTAGCAAITTLSIGAGYYTALALNASPETAAEATLAANEAADAPDAKPRLAVAALADEDVKLSPIFARFPSPDNELAAISPAVNAARSFTLAAASPSDVTGSVATPAPKPPPPKVVSMAMFSEPKTSDAAPASARTGTQVAALSPSDIKIAPQVEEARPRTAVYDITTKIVYMPNGEKLEAHSGYGMFMDSPKHVNMKMRGSTPPNVYRLRLRERLFHGVAAIRMLPEDESVMHNRNGILAHSYLLGPSGQSHGCVSFKDYPRFLRAFQRGEVDRMVVVARMDHPPAFYARRGTKDAVAKEAAVKDAAPREAAMKEFPAVKSDNEL